MDHWSHLLGMWDRYSLCNKSEYFVSHKFILIGIHILNLLKLLLEPGLIGYYICIYYLKKLQILVVTYTKLSIGIGNHTRWSRGDIVLE